MEKITTQNMTGFLTKEEAEALYNPKSIALVGISRREDSLGKKLLNNLLSFGYQGTIYLIHPKQPTIAGIQANASLLDIEKPIDMVVSLISSKYILQLVDDCVSKKIKTLVIITAGFSESGEEGKKLEKQVAERAVKANIRIVGPNSMGVFHGYDKKMNATFSPVEAKTGRIAFLSQSGAIGAVLMHHAMQSNLGLSKFVSMGNKVDLNTNYLLNELRDDENTDVILLYLESFTNAREFKTVASEISKEKPIIMVKSGRTAAGARAASSHTGALAGEERIVATALENLGIIRADSIEDMFHIAKGFVKTKPVLGENVAIVSNAGGPGTLTTDECVAHQLNIAKLSTDTTANLKALLPPEASYNNPSDILPSASPEIYKQVTEYLLNDPNINSVVVLILPPVLYPLKDMLDAINEIKHKKPIFCVAMGCEGRIENSEQYNFPIYYHPRTVATVIRAMSQFSVTKEQLTTAEKHWQVADANRNQVNSILKFAAESGRKNLNQDEITQIMQSYDIPVPFLAIADNKETLLTNSAKMGYPVVVKMASEQISHKSDAGGVLLDLQNETEVENAWNTLQSIYETNDVALDDRKVLIQKYYNNYKEIAIGALRDPLFGEVVMVGFGGIMIEIFKDTQFHLAPVTLEQAEKMIERLSMYPLLQGFRGDKGVNITKLADYVVKISNLISNHLLIKEIDINPMFADENEFVAIDIRIILE